MNHKTTIKIYEVNNEYINILANIDKEVRFAKKSFRPYLFTKILLAQNKEYLIPFSSPKNLKKDQETSLIVFMMLMTQLD